MTWLFIFKSVFFNNFKIETPSAANTNTPSAIYSPVHVTRGATDTYPITFVWQNTVMPLLDDNLTIWKIAFRWAGLDPESLLYRFFIPTEAKDNIRLVLNAILTNSLYCTSLKADEFLKNDTKSNRYKLNNIGDCISDSNYDRDFLKSHSIYRSDFAHWCNRTGIPYPEFWFPPGWAVHELNEKDRLADVAPHYESASVIVNLLPATDKSSGKRVKAEETIWKPARAVANALWSEDKSLTITAVTRRIKAMSHLKAASKAESTVRKRIAHLAPAGIRGVSGRKPTKKLT